MGQSVCRALTADSTATCNIQGAPCCVRHTKNTRGPRPKTRARARGRALAYGRAAGPATEKTRGSQDSEPQPPDFGNQPTQAAQATHRPNGTSFTSHEA